MSVRSTVGDPRHPALAVQAKARAASIQNRQNEELLKLSNQIRDLTDEVRRLTIEHARAAAGMAAPGPQPTAPTA